MATLQSNFFFRQPCLLHLQAVSFSFQSVFLSKMLSISTNIYECNIALDNIYRRKCAPNKKQNVVRKKGHSILIDVLFPQPFYDIRTEVNHSLLSPQNLDLDAHFYEQIGNFFQFCLIVCGVLLFFLTDLSWIYFCGSVYPKCIQMSPQDSCSYCCLDLLK